MDTYFRADCIFNIYIVNFFFYVCTFPFTGSALFYIITKFNNINGSLHVITYNIALNEYLIIYNKNFITVIKLEALLEALLEAPLEGLET
jgi:hypothetical protein